MASMNPFEGLLGGGQVAGGLLSPEMSMASALLQASGPSRMPVSMGQALAQGIDAYGRAAAQQNAQQMQQKLLDAKVGSYDLERQKLERETAIQQARVQIIGDPNLSQLEKAEKLIALGDKSGIDLYKATKPDVSNAAKMAKEIGLQPGTPEYNAFIYNYANKTDSTTIKMPAQMPAAPSGMYYKSFNPPELAPIPGGPADVAARAAADAPDLLASSSEMANLIVDAINHPGRAGSTGGTSIIPTLPGGDRANFQVLLDQITGKTFLEAFQALKGAGSITETEGAKAEASRARLQTSQSDDAFATSLVEYLSIIQKGVNAERAKAKLPPVDFLSMIPADVYETAVKQSRNVTPPPPQGYELD